MEILNSDSVDLFDLTDSGKRKALWDYYCNSTKCTNFDHNATRILKLSGVKLQNNTDCPDCKATMFNRKSNVINKLDKTEWKPKYRHEDKVKMDEYLNNLDFARKAYREVFNILYVNQDKIKVGRSPLLKKLNNKKLAVKLIEKNIQQLQKVMDNYVEENKKEYPVPNW